MNGVDVVDPVAVSCCVQARGTFEIQPAGLATEMQPHARRRAAHGPRYPLSTSPRPPRHRMRRRRRTKRTLNLEQNTPISLVFAGRFGETRTGGAETSLQGSHTPQHSAAVFSQRGAHARVGKRSILSLQALWRLATASFASGACKRARDGAVHVLRDGWVWNHVPITPERRPDDVEICANRASRF